MGFFLENTEHIINKKTILQMLEKHVLCTKSEKQQLSISKWVVKPESNSNKI